MAKDNFIWTNWQPTEWEKIFLNYKFERGLILEIYKKTVHQKNIAQLKVNCGNSSQKIKYK